VQAPTSILVVDDQPDVLEMVCRFLERSFPEARVLAAQSGAEALDILADEDVGAVVSDYRMPGIDGIEVLRRAGATRPAAGRILMSAFDEGDLSRRARDSGVHSFIERSDPDELVRAVRSALA